MTEAETAIFRQGFAAGEAEERKRGLATAYLAISAEWTDMAEKFKATDAGTDGAERIFSTVAAMVAKRANLRARIAISDYKAETAQMKQRRLATA